MVNQKCIKVKSFIYIFFTQLSYITKVTKITFEQYKVENYGKTI